MNAFQSHMADAFSAFAVTEGAGVNGTCNGQTKPVMMGELTRTTSAGPRGGRVTEISCECSVLSSDFTAAGWGKGQQITLPWGTGRIVTSPDTSGAVATFLVSGIAE